MKTIVCISDLQVPYHDVEATKAVARVYQGVPTRYRCILWR
jgi:hypothetical protein